MKEQKIELAKLRFTSNRPYGGDGSIENLAESMKAVGLINKINVKPSDKEPGTYLVIAGRRRTMAAALLKWKDISAEILEGDEIARAEEIAAAENINREAMHPLDEATLFKKLLANGEAIEALSKRFDRKVSEILQRVQLLDLNEDIKSMFKNGQITLLTAAMLKNLNEEGQKAFFKEFKNDWSIKHGEGIDDHEVKSFISNLDHDRLYGFLRDKQCAGCKTRTFFTDKNLFPELDNMSENCFNHKCYAQKWEKILTDRIKSLKGERKSHSAACIITSSGDEFLKIVGKEITIDGIKFKVLSDRWDTRANAKDKGAQPCFKIDISRSGKLEITSEYWKEAEKSSGGLNASSPSKRKELAPIVNLLDLPKEQADETLNAMNNSKRISPYTFSSNIRDSVFWRVIEIKAQEFNDPKKVDHVCKEIFLKKYLSNINGGDKKIFETFAGKESISDIAKLTSDKIFALLCAMEWSAWEMLSPDDLSKGNKANSDILKWIGLTPDKLKKLYQEEIQKRVPKQKPDVKPKREAKTKIAEKPGVKKTARKKLPSAKKLAAKKAVAKKLAKGKQNGKRS